MANKLNRSELRNETKNELENKSSINGRWVAELLINVNDLTAIRKWFEIKI